MKDFKQFREEIDLQEAASVSVTVQATAPADKKYAVTEIHPRKSPRGRTRWKDVSYHGSAEEAKAAADAHAKKNNLHRLKSSVAEEVELEESTIKVGDTVVWNKGKTAQTVGKVHKIEDDSYVLHHAKTNTYHKVPKQGSELVKEDVELDEAMDFKKEAAKHMKDLHSKDSTAANKAYAQKMLQRALEASKMKDPVAAKKHYTGVSEEVESVDEATLPPHLVKLIKDKQLDKVPIKHVTPRSEKQSHTIKDVTPKGYGPTKEEVEESFAADFLAMAKQKNPNARISTADQRSKEAEELAKKRAGLKPAHAAPTSNPRPLGGYDPKSNRSYSEEVEIEEAKGPTIHKSGDTIHVKDKKGEIVKKFPHTPKGLEYAKQFVKQNKHLGEDAELPEEKMLSFLEHALDEAPYMGKGNHRPGWMLRADPELARKVKANIDAAKLRQKYMGKTADEIAKMKKEEAELEEGRGAYDELARRMGTSSPGFNKTPAGKAREQKRRQEHLKGQMKFTQRMGGVSGPKGKLPEEVELEEGSATSRKPFRDINSPEYKAAAEKQREKMAKDKVAEPGKKLLDKIEKRK